MTSVLLVGTGEVAVRAARQLLDTPGLDRLLVTGRDGSRANDIAAALGRSVEAVPWPAVGDKGVPPGTDAVAIAVPAVPTLEWARRAVRNGVHAAVVADTDDDLGALLALDGDARRTGSVLVAGCGLVPGLSDVLARHAADALDRADEVHVTRGPARPGPPASKLCAARRTSGRSSGTTARGTRAGSSARCSCGSRTRSGPVSARSRPPARPSSCRRFPKRSG